MEGLSTTATSRVGAHNVTPYVLGITEKDTLTVTWVDPRTTLPKTDSWPSLRKKEARKAWKSISRVAACGALDLSGRKPSFQTRCQALGQITQSSIPH